MIQSLSAQPERRSLPALGHPLPPIQVWKVIKEAFGSSKIMAMPLPMQLHEPTSELMKRAEDLAYASLLNEVRMFCTDTYISAFLACLSCSWQPPAVPAAKMSTFNMLEQSQIC